MLHAITTHEKQRRFATSLSTMLSAFTVLVVLSAVTTFVSGGQRTSASTTKSTSAIKRRLAELGRRSDRPQAFYGAAAARGADNRPEQFENKPTTSGGRRLENTCDAALVACVPDDACIGCFEDLNNKDIDWASTSSETPCGDVVDLITAKGHCLPLLDDAEGKSAFCDTLNSCVTWGDDEHEDSDGGLDCSKLTKCEWEGMNPSFIGDGICQQFQCYNSKECDFDGGDCCEDKCESTAYGSCGDDGYACRDSRSKHCDPSLTNTCRDPEGPHHEPIQCGENERLFALIQYDSWGDGWDMTKLVMKEANTDKVVYEGGLEKGRADWAYLCLPDGCYSVSVTGGLWGVEVSWELRLASGPPNVAWGGAPMECTFAIGGNSCENSCTGKVEDNSEADLSDCEDDKCVIQLGACKSDIDCAPCLVQDPPKYCHTNDKFGSLVDCSICQCSLDEEGAAEYCENQGKSDEPTDEEHTFEDAKCTARETLGGSQAVMSFSKCSDISGVDAMMDDWDHMHFANIGKFDSCANQFKEEKATALDCMKNLGDVANGSSEDVDYIRNMATDLYKKGETFCNCAVTANNDCPTCPKFVKFKQLLQESIAACNALDDIDCPAWEEFSGPCKENMQSKFGEIDFSQQEQCDFIESGCNGVGTFPAFRRLDCDGEISEISWEFFNSYSTRCHADDLESVEAPTSDANPTASYVPPEQRRSAKFSESTPALLWVFVVGGIFSVGAFVYRKRRNSQQSYIMSTEYRPEPQLVELVEGNEAASPLSPEQPAWL